MIYKSDRLAFFEPSVERDDAIKRLFDVPENTRHIAHLCGMGGPAWLERRNAHRSGFASGTSWFVDVALLKSGDEQLIGTTGFREITRDGVGEWGVLIDCHHWQQGKASECLSVCIEHSQSIHLRAIVAVTSADNTAMLRFLAKHRFVRQQSSEPWLRFELRLANDTTINT